MYLRPDYRVRPWHILRWRLATSLPYRRTAGPDAGLHVSTYVLGIGQTDTSGSNWIDRYSLCKSPPPRASFRVVHFKSHKNPFWCSLAIPFALPSQRQKVVNSLPAIDAHERQRFNKLCGTVVSRRIFIRSQSLIAR